jgi:hypothetical protein
VVRILRRERRAGGEEAENPETRELSGIVDFIVRKDQTFIE